MHNVYGNHLVYDGNLAYALLKNEDVSVKLLSSYSTAFIAPSLYQLYDGYAGNIDLKPESNKTFEAGFDVSYQDWVQFDAVYFNRAEEDAIIYDNTTYKYANGSSDANGFEVNTKITPLNSATDNPFLIDWSARDFWLCFSATANKFVTGIDITPFENAFLNFTYRNVGERTIFDRYGSFGTAGDDVILEEYQVLDFMANFKFKEFSFNLMLIF